MKFTPRSEEEVSRLFEKGTYRFKVMEAQECKSKAGNPQMRLKLQLKHDKFFGKTNLVNCYLLTDNPNFEFLLRHFCHSVGLISQYEKGELTDSMCAGKEGMVKVGIESDEEGKYPDKNKVLDFVIPKNGESFEAPTPFDDEIPFA
jgi:hypothetical protein